MERFAELLREALRQVPIKKKTRVSKGAKLRRLEEKNQRGILKTERSKRAPWRIRHRRSRQFGSGGLELIITHRPRSLTNCSVPCLAIAYPASFLGSEFPRLTRHLILETEKNTKSVRTGIDFYPCPKTASSFSAHSYNKKMEMNMTKTRSPGLPLDDKGCYAAMQAHDARFDGRFFCGVSSTGIYCRPICRVKLPKEENCAFFVSAAAAEAAGYRPCLRCRPELAPGLAPVDSVHRLARSAALTYGRGLPDPPQNFGTGGYIKNHGPASAPRLFCRIRRIARAISSNSAVAFGQKLACRHAAHSDRRGDGRRFRQHSPV